MSLGRTRRSCPRDVAWGPAAWLPTTSESGVTEMSFSILCEGRLAVWAACPGNVSAKVPEAHAGTLRPGCTAAAHPVTGDASHALRALPHA